MSLARARDGIYSYGKERQSTYNVTYGAFAKLMLLVAISIT